MSRAPAQLPLGVGLRDDATFDNYHPGANATLVECLSHQFDDNGEPFLYLWGGDGVGRSHLLQAACHQASARDLRTLYLPLEELGHFPPLMLEDVERLDLVAIDDLDRVVGRKRWEEALFHAFNRLRDSGKRLLIAADRPPRQLDIKLADLASRLTWGMTFHLRQLSDEDRMQALKLRAHLRGMELPDEVARYILHRGARELSELFRSLEVLDNASLSAQRKLTIPFVKKALDW
ncbi:MULTISPECIES: DnaA regulatory inactivator Hda [Halomonas]|uniref:DnaA regulatory inactivator Hda n=2 Tax=Halomonas TaxID=2745 RepID=A0AAU7KE97_9GAMM|nr:MULTISPECIES: DnaA regulatory inactivator Hda [Halomonas]MBR9770540.1 DnaA regulatory inactivator Hda [Gammaproteobacteria bacterium]KJZ16216.1 DNA replication initiation factor [Halomonas sp. S2151]MAR73314.1 DnaA regulatory inactivator Hda [Halomonas sp.]MBY6111278.1 DnaA regulatory inactivator Hda [Halomonas sp. DP1Y21-3]MCJ8287552.1 DnaA regulatory inactivator Hda [Halomonas sp.]|tara:strand:- start:390 stop:1091 length:702 start_codon:yes stop_codon:yes gene_type:complete